MVSIFRLRLCFRWGGQMGVFSKIFKQVMILISIAFFFYASYQGVVGDGGSTSVFTGVGALIVVLLGSYFIDKLVQD